MFLTFTHMDVHSVTPQSTAVTAGDINCTTSYVRVQDGDASDAPVVGTYCLTRIPAPITSQVLFIETNGRVKRVYTLSIFRDRRYSYTCKAHHHLVLDSGLRILPYRKVCISLIALEKYEEIIHSILFLLGCGGQFTSEHGSFSSPLYPSSYPLSTECIWTITASAGL